MTSTGKQEHLGHAAASCSERVPTMLLSCNMRASGVHAHEWSRSGPLTDQGQSRRAIVLKPVYAMW